MNPLTIANIVTLFLTAATTSAGTSAGTNLINLLFKRFERSGKQEARQSVEEIQKKPFEADKEPLRIAVATEAEKDPTFGGQVIDALNTDLVEHPSLVNSIVQVVGDWWNLSSQQEVAQKGKCPIGGEILVLPRYLNPDGTEIEGAIFNLRGFGGLPHSTIAECRRRHQWPVFAVKRPRQ